jgi:long-chain acyl-CoA synthetase
MPTRAEAIKVLTAKGEPFELQGLEIAGRTCRVFVNAPATLRDLYEASRADLPFIVYDDDRMTFETFWRQACTLAWVLVEELKVQPGDRVAISMRNYPEWMIAFAAATSVGAIAVAMNALWQPAEMAHGLADARPRVLLVDQERLDRLLASDGYARDLSVIAVRAGRALPTGVLDFQAVISRPERMTMPDVAISPDAAAIMLYTSGSTGHPKGAVSTHRNVISALLSWELDGQVALLTGAASSPAAGAQAATLLAIPLFHVTGLHAVFLYSFRSQRRLISLYKWDAELAAEIIERERVTSFTAPAAVTGDLVETARRTKHNLDSLVTVGGGGAPRAPGQVRDIDAVFKNAQPGIGWGMTETNAIGTGIAGQAYLERPTSSGRGSAVLDLRIVDEAGNVLPPMQRGEVQVRGTSVMTGYWDRPDANAEIFSGEWLRTGDVAYLDDEGFIYIVDRIKDLVIRGGENIGCGAVEAALLEHPAILEAAVYGVPDARLGEEVAATVYAREPVTLDEVSGFLKTRLAAFQIPRHFRAVSEPLPRIASGKILKRQLRLEAIADLEQPG